MNHVAYTGFKATIDFKFHPAMSFVPDVERTVEVVEGDTETFDPNPPYEEHIELPQRPPNQVREEADMPQPVLVTDKDGNGHEEWKKPGKTPKLPAIPKHNKVKGAA